MISIRSVQKRFGRVAALAGVSLDIRAGERVALVGSNGSGKTTLLRALCGLLRVDGTIEIFGVSVAREPALALSSLAYMPQVTPPLDVPVAELVRAYVALRGCDGTRVERCAADLGLELSAIAKSRVRDLSGGMKQKLLASLALSADAPILVCDEPSASLDAAARAAFFKLVKARSATSTLILCSHRLDEVRELVERVVELKDGKVLHDGPVREALAQRATCHIELSFGAGALSAQELFLLSQLGFEVASGARFAGRFTQTRKLEVVERVVQGFVGKLADIQIVDSESLPAARDVAIKRAS